MDCSMARRVELNNMDYNLTGSKRLLTDQINMDYDLVEANAS